MHNIQERVHEIRDPIHGAIVISAPEYRLMRHPSIRRLRGIRQLGFSQIPFPGATHSRFSHSIGVMDLAGRAFDSIFSDGPFSSRSKRSAYRGCLRLAALLHDVGHGPFSHAAEFAMPCVSTLGFDETRTATHEDYTVAILTRSSLSEQIAVNFPFTGKHIAALIDPSIVIEDDFFIDKGFNLRGIFSQLISSNLDLDRMDYLVRDSYFSGARYGQIDVNWLINHLGRNSNHRGDVNLALKRVALYAFEDFLHARLQMFLNVYFHRKSVGMELMLQQYMCHEDCSYRLPSDLNEYVYADDAQLWSHLRQSSNPFAHRVVEHRPYKVAIERHGPPDGTDLSVREKALADAGIHALGSVCIGKTMSPPAVGKPQITILSRDIEGVRQNLPLIELPLRQAHDLACINRIYVPEEDLEQARRILAGMSVEAEQQILL